MPVFKQSGRANAFSNLKNIVLNSVSLAAMLASGTTMVNAEELRPAYSPPANNGGGANPGRADIITIAGESETITGDYALRGTSYKRFSFNAATVAERNAMGEVVSGFDAVDGEPILALGPQQKTSAITYPDAIQGTRQATLVYDNDRLVEVGASTALTINYRDDNNPVYGDLRLANISDSDVTITTGSKSKSLYDKANFALLTADSGSTLYNVTDGSTIVYDSRTATMNGLDQNGLSQARNVTYSVPVTTYSGVAFNGTDSVTDLASLKRYNSSLIAQLSQGAITPEDYERLIKAAAPVSFARVTVENRVIPPFTAPPTTSARRFIRLDNSTLTTTIDSQLVGVAEADANSAGNSTLIEAVNGSTIINNGILTQAQQGPGVLLTGAGTGLTNSVTGVIGVGYETLDRSGGSVVPTGLGGRGFTTNNVAVSAANGALVSNQGIINVANRDVPGETRNATIGKANAGIVVASGAQASNSGTILIGGGASAVADNLGQFRGAAGMAALNGGTATNRIDGIIRVGTTFAENAADLAAVQDIQSVNHASGMASVSGGGALINNGTIRIGSLAQNANGMLIGGDGGTAVNRGAIIIDASAVTTPSARNAAMSVLGSSVVNAVSAANAGTITINGVNSVGLLVENSVAGGAARALNSGTITINGGLSADRLRNYGVFVGNATSSAQQNGAVVMTGEGAIGVHARNGGRIDVGSGGGVDFQGSNQIGYYALGAGSTVNINSTTDVDTASSTGLRVEGGAIARGDGLAFNVSGANAFGIVATGASSGLTVDTMDMQMSVSGPGAVGVLIEGGATGLVNGASSFALTGSGATAAIVDGQAHALDGTAVGAPVATTSLTSDASLASSADNLTGYVARNQGQLTNAGTISFTGAGGVGIVATTGATATNSGAIGVGAGGTAIRLVSTGASDVVRASNSAALTLSGAGTTGFDLSGGGASAVHSGSVTVTGSGTGVRIANGASFTNQGTVTVASGTGILIDGAGSTLVGGGSSPVTVNDGVAALRLVNGGSANSGASFNANGTAHGVLLDSGAGALTLGGGTIAVGGSGNGIENVANSSAITLNGTTIVANGSGSAIRTAVALDPASTATLIAAGTNSTGFTFGGAGGATTSNALTLGNGLAIEARGTGATGVRLATTGAATLTGSVAVTNAQGGSALVAGPAASVTNSGTLTSASTTAPVVDLTGGTSAFTNSGTITASSATATAIAGGTNGQTVTLSSGAVTGAVALGSGNDTFLMTGGTLTGAFTGGAGNDDATFRGLTDANLSGVSSIAGNGTAGGNDVLTFDATSATGTRRISGWNAINILRGSTLTADGNLTLASGGTATIDATSTLNAGNGVNAVVGGADGGSATLVNAGVIDLTTGSSGATDTLTVRGNYVGQNGTIRMQTVLAGDGSPSDRLIIDGGAVSGTTTLQIANAGGLGAATTGNGIEVVSAINGGTTTATTTGTGFALAGEHVDAGAFEYRLFASNTTGTNQSWYLRTQGSGQTEEPTPTPTPTTYRPEVALLAAVPHSLRLGDLAMLATYHKRMGDEEGTAAPGFAVPGRVWGRMIAEDQKFRQRGDARPEIDGRRYGFQLGVDLFRYGSAAGSHHFGVYGGYTDGNDVVRGFASGVERQYVGKLDPKTTHAGLYWTYLSNSGLYVDTVVQHSWYGGDATSANGNRVDIEGTGVLASVEAGYGIALSPAWTLEPQVQVIVQGNSIDDVGIPNATVSQDSDGYVTGRLGLRAKGRFETNGGSIQPYLRANLWKGFQATDRTYFRTAAATTLISTRTSSLWGEAGAGLTWTLKPGFAIYGEADHRFSLGDGRGVAGHSTSGSVGVKISL